MGSYDRIVQIYCLRVFISLVANSKSLWNTIGQYQQIISENGKSERVLYQELGLAMYENCRRKKHKAVEKVKQFSEEPIVGVGGRDV